MAYLGSEKNSGFGAGTYAVSVPAGVVDGDYLVTFVVNTGTVGQSTPAGWTSQGTAGAPIKTRCYSRVASSEPASYNWVATGGAGGDLVSITTLAYRGTPASDVWTGGQTVDAAASPPTAAFAAGTLAGEANGVTTRLAVEVWAGTSSNNLPAQSGSTWTLREETVTSGGSSYYVVDYRDKITSAAFADDTTTLTGQSGDGPRQDGARWLGPSWTDTIIYPGDPGDSGGGYFGFVMTLGEATGDPPTSGTSTDLGGDRRKVVVRALPTQVRSGMPPEVHARASASNFDHIMSVLRAIVKQHNLVADDIKTINDRVNDLDSNSP
jgi:hypothetical protein